MNVDAAKPAFEAALRHVADAFGMEEAIIRGKNKATAPKLARRLVAFALRSQGFSYPEIGHAMGICHTSAMRMCRYEKSESEKELVLRIVADLPKRTTSDLDEDAMWSQQADEDREAFDAIRRELAVLPPRLRIEAWAKAVREMFPYSYERQAAMLPRGCA